MVRGLKPALAAAHPVLAAAAEVAAVKTNGGLNIEALEISPDQRQLLIGLRSPLLDGRAIIARVENLAALFEDGVLPHVSSGLITLELGGSGIRGMAYLPALGGYLIISGPVARQQVQFQLCFWIDAPGTAARRVSVAGLPGYEHAEGISLAVIEGRECIVIVSDDGDREVGRYANFLLLDPQQLMIAVQQPSSAQP